MPFSYLVTNNFFYWLDRELMCTAMNPSGKEYVCGFGYDHTAIRTLLYYVVPGAWFISLVVGGIAWMKSGLGKHEKAALLVSLTILVGVIVLAASVSNDDMP